MVQKAITTIVDDLDGTELTEDAAEMVSFALDGKAYEIDLSLANARALRAALLPYTEAGRKLGRAPAAKTSTSTRRSDLAEIRAWAAQNGHQVAPRGRIHYDVVAAYDAAHAS
ncbi:histone-like nucleoid-structuring protein Lsr2 [Pseudoclavibacter sp. VKM Ac-2867]|uniref:histone-like nucleoid-structuring protein Lsr2 n=1 Tax=Pseudoclavibacter sp. VKM Ac-2867 TaxID=2783829 RepID=UPI00188AB7B1|nr:Lsr2 family protein [Pseudoclavibacter sp. VKM Ac-2867]MBF4459548.1 Lsr2 family protein [Pseudoclavibacter sp. VKM Ac-2867]